MSGTPGLMNIVVVEPDPMQQEMLMALLNLGFPDCQIYGAERGVGALELIEEIKTDLVICECTLPDLSGIEVATRAQTDNPPIAFIMLSESPANLAVHENHPEVAMWMAKPLDADRLLSEAGRRLLQARRPPLYNLTLPGLLQVVADGREDCCLTILSDSSKGRLHFQHGSVVHAVAGPLVGLEALHAMLEWPLHYFSTAPVRRDMPCTISGSLTALLLDAAFLHDEACAVSVEQGGRK